MPSVEPGTVQGRSISLPNNIEDEWCRLHRALPALKDGDTAGMGDAFRSLGKGAPQICTRG